MKNLKYEVDCVVCGNNFKTNLSNQKICSPNCRTKLHGRQNRISHTHNLSTGVVGSISEIAIAKYLMLDGYSVFRAISPSCFCDLIAVKDSENMYIEARTGYKDITGKLYYPTHISSNNGLPTHYAIYVMDDDSVSLIKITEKDYEKNIKKKK